MNPLVDDVVAAFDRVPREHPTGIEIDRTGVDLPQGEHFEGIQRLSADPELLVITSASSHQAYFVTCDMASDGLSGRARSPITMARSPFRHSGGCQGFDRFLVVGVEDPDNRQTSEVQFWDFTRFPTQLVSMTVPRSGDYQVSTAG